MQRIGPAILAVLKAPQSQFRYCLWYRSSHGTNFDISEIASPDVHVLNPWSCSLCLQAQSQAASWM